MEEFTIDYSMVIQHLKQIGRVKNLINGIFIALTASQKIIFLKCHLLLFYATTVNHFVIGLWCLIKMDFVQQLAMTNWVAVPGRSSKSLPKMKFATKKVMIPVWWSAAGMKHYNFLKWSESCSVVSYSLWLHGLYSPLNSPGQNTGVGSLSLPQGIFPTQGWNKSLRHCRKIIYQLSHKGSSQLSESWQNHYIWEVCSANQWDALKSSTTTVSTGSTERAQFCTITPGNISHNQHFKSWMNWTTKFCLIHHNHLTSH